MARYEISIKGRLDPSLLTDLGRFESDERPCDHGPARVRWPTRPGLRRLLTRLQDRGLELVEVRQIDPDEPGD